MGITLINFLNKGELSNEFMVQIVWHQGRAATGYAIASVAMAKEFQKTILFGE
jgi:hypothetical protein